MKVTRCFSTPEAYMHACKTTCYLYFRRKHRLYLVLNLIFVQTKDFTFKVWNELYQKSRRLAKKSKIASRCSRQHWKVRHRAFHICILVYSPLFLFNHISHRNFSSSNIILKLLWQMTCGFQIRKIVHKNLKLWTWKKTCPSTTKDYFLISKH